MRRTALITGVSGQDGAYLAQFLLQQGYRVVGARRRSASGTLPRLEELGIARDIDFVDLDLAEITNILRTLDKVKPDEIYNLAAQSFVALSFEQPIYTADIGGLGPLRLLEAVRQVMPAARFYQASTSEMFGKVTQAPQDETTPFHPRSPYGFAKLMGHWATVNYRDSYGLRAACGIMFNHESPLRGREFVTRKITLSLARIRHGDLDALDLGNLDAARDWGFAGDYVKAMWLMLQQEAPQDFVLASGETRTVRAFVEAAALRLGFDLDWVGAGRDERALDRRSGKTIVRIEPQLYRPAEVDALIGNPSRAEELLGWRRTVGFDALVTMMAEADERRVRDNTLQV
ncbi:MAG: GDP-mannose 4,6-dehydratase [Thiohalocapsa sp.]